MCYTTKDTARGGVVEATSFFAKRVNRIYPSYLMILVPFLLFSIFIKGDWSWYQIIGNIFLLPTFNSDPSYYMYVTPSWTLVYEMFFYFVFSIAILFSKNKMNIIITTSTFIVLMIFFVRVLDFQGERLKWVNFRFMIGDTLMLDFIAGCFYSIFYVKLNEIGLSNRKLLFGAIVFFIIGMILAKFDFPRLLAFGIPALIIVVSISLYRMSSKNKVSSFFIFMGDASYSIYLIHYLFAAILSRIHIADNKIYFIASTVFMILSVLAGILFHLFFERKLSKSPLIPVR